MIKEYLQIEAQISSLLDQRQRIMMFGKYHSEEEKQDLIEHFNLLGEKLEYLNEELYNLLKGYMKEVKEEGGKLLE